MGQSSSTASSAGFSSDTLDPNELYKKSPPAFGHAIAKYFAFDAEYLNFNHGAFGSVPLPVSAAARKLSKSIEANPDHFFHTSYLSLLPDVRRQLAEMIGADTDECVLVSNATTGINVVLRNFRWEKEDIIVTLNTTYRSVERTTQYLSDIAPHPTVYNFTVNFPTTPAAIIVSFREFLRALPRIRGNKVVAVIDSIISAPGVLMPWQEMVNVCKEESVWSVIDAAHSIGQEPDINLSEAKPDFWVSNCHKWLYSMRGCAVLYVPKRNQHIVISSIPTAHWYISPADRKDHNFVTQFQWTGTVDAVAYLSVLAALEFRNWIGGEASINEYCHRTTLEGGKRLIDVLGTRLLDPEGDMTANMVNVELPMPSHIEYTQELEQRISLKLLEGHNMSSKLYYHNGAWWIRCCSQVWTEVEDFQKLGKAWLAVIAEISQEFEAK